MTASQDVKQRLERKATFEAAVRELTCAVKALSPSDTVATAAATAGAELDLVPRVHTLLKARYSNPAFWKAGLELFKAVQASGHAPAPLQAKLPTYLKDAETFVIEGLGTESEPQPREQTLGELLLGLPPPSAAAQQSHLSDAGLVLDHESYPAPSSAAAEAAARQLLGQPPPPAAAEEQAQQQQAGSEQQQGRQQQQQQGQQQQQQQEGQEGAEEPDQESIAALLQESLLQAGGSNRAELEAMLLSMVEQQTAAHQPSRPAASKRAVASLRIIHIDTPEALESVGGPATKCPVCTDSDPLPLPCCCCWCCCWCCCCCSMVEQQTAAHQPSRPAASKRAVASLPIIHIDTPETLETVGGPSTKCPVCTEELVVGDRVQQLPCKHVFHVDCLKPWLQQDNSCPVCRQELPTDDHSYEARKEREAQDAEERKGAANALSHNEFAYI